ncbi:hypothetical protein [Streptomyces sp. NPDC001665]
MTGFTEPPNAFNLRYSLPDSSDGKGIDATLSAYADGKALPDPSSPPVGVHANVALARFS